MSDYSALLTPFRIGNVLLRNRVMSTSHAPAYAEDGNPTERYQLYHLEKARGGIGLTMFGGSASVSPDSPATPWSQIDVGRDEVVPWFQQFARRIHDEGAALMCQLTHMGRRTRWDAENWFPTVSASAVREPAHRSFPREMEDWDIRRVVRDFGQAARRCKEGGLDGCELMAHGHLIDQFWTPTVNRRTDGYGGSLENRMRFSLEVLEEVRKQVGDEFIVGIRLSGDELLEGGLSPDDCMAIGRRLAGTGMISYFNVNCAYIETDRGLGLLIPNMSRPVAPYLYLPSAYRQAFGLPVFHAGRIADVATAARAVEEGHVDLVAMTRAHLADPHIVRKIQENRAEDIRQCVGASYCLDRIYLGGDALCIQNPATGREATLPHVIRRRPESRRVVVVGAGVAGLEAARVCAESGHRVTLFERETRTGGQVNIAARADWREGLSGIVRWLDQQVRKLGVDLRLGAAPDAAAVLAEAPDYVVIATGGRPNLGEVRNGPELAMSTWDLLEGRVEPAANILLYDDHGGDAGPGTASFAARRGALVELVTPERKIGVELGATSYATHLEKLYETGVVITPDTRLREIYREGGKLIAVLRNEYTDAEEERVVDQVLIEHGTLPRDALYFALKAGSRNLGEVDLRALAANRLEPVVNNPEGRYFLYRIGDAAASRNIHAALYDALRLCKEF